MTKLSNEEMVGAIDNISHSISTFEDTGCLGVAVPAKELLSLCKKLREVPILSFDFLLMHTAIHWPDETFQDLQDETTLSSKVGVIELLYRLYSTEHQHYLLLSTKLSAEHPLVQSVATIWPIAEWQEREVYDLFGVLYQDHPDFRRLLLDDDWSGFPLRKDYVDEFMLKPPGSSK